MMTSRKLKLAALIGGVAAVTLAATAQAEAIYSTSFEAPVFTATGPLLGIDGWSTAIPPFLNAGAASVTRRIAAGGEQSVVVKGADLLGSGGITSPYDAVGSYRRPVDYPVNPEKPIVRIEGELMLETKKPETPGEFFSLTLSARANGETVGEVGLSSKGEAEAFGFNAVPGSDPAFTHPIRFNRWNHVEMEIDFAKRTTTYFVNGDLLGQVPAPTVSISSTLQRGSMVVYARPDGDETGGPGSRRGSYKARFDRFRISAHEYAEH